MTATPVTSAPETRRRQWRLDAAVLAAIAILIRIPAFVSDRHLTYDDGVFGASALLMRDGQLPYRDIFSPQGPLHLPLVFVADLVGFRTANAPRILPLVAAAVVTVATYSIGRRIATRGGALLAAGLVTTSGSVLYTTAPITSDGPALAFALLAVALAFAYRDDPTLARALGTGAALGAALSIKSLVLPALIPVVVLLWSSRRRKDFAAAAGAALAVGLVTTLPWGFGTVWDQSIAYHQESSRITSHWGAVEKVVTTLIDRDLPTLVAAALALVFLLIARGPAPRTQGPRVDIPDHGRGDAILLLVWLGVLFALLVYEPALWRPHVAHLIPPIALLVAMRPPPWPALAVAGIVVAPFWWSSARPMLWPDAPDGPTAAVVADLEALPPGAQVITDELGLAWRADRLVPGELVDASIKRIQQEQITTDVLLDAAAEPEVCAVAVWSARYGDLPGLAERLADEGYEVAAEYGGPRVLYVKQDCEAP
jgi:hypothetical protein